MLLSHNPLPVAVVISAIDRSHLFTMAVSVLIARLSVKFFSSHSLLGEGGSFSRGCCCFFFAAGCCCFRFKMASLFFTYHCFTVSGSWLGMTKLVSVKEVHL